MALYSLRLRRTLTTLSSLTNHHRTLPTLPSISSSSSSSSPLLQTLISSSPSLPIQSRPFKSSSLSLSSFRSNNNNNSYNDQDDKLDPNAILFEGCDYNHWLITMDFPKNPEDRPSPEQMVDTYVETCAKGLNISIEDAKKKIYACSTTTYEGFQAVMTEEESEKFRGLPGVVFILPDSYIDPANKEYGGDKYIDGVIIPRPPPIRYGRQGREPYVRRVDQPRFDQQRQQGNPPYNEQRPMQGDGRNHGPPQYSPPLQNRPDGQGERRGPMPLNNNDFASGGGYQGERRESLPPYQANYNQADRRNVTPQEQRDFRGDNRSYGQAVGGPYGQVAGAQGQGASGSYGQGAGGYGQVAGAQGQGASGSYGHGVGGYGQVAGAQGERASGSYGQGGGGSHGQGAGAQGQGAGASYGQGAGAQGQGAGASYGQGYGASYGQGVVGSYGQGAGSQGVGGSYGQGEGGQRSPVEQRNYTNMGQSVTDQGRY